MIRRSFVVGLALTCISAAVWAQEEESQVNPNSLLSIPKYEQLYKVRVWRIIDLREKQNKGFFARGNEITKLLIRAINSGELADIYERDSLTVKLSKEQFNANMVTQQGETFATWEPGTDYYQGDPVTFGGKNYEAVVNSKGKNPSTSPDDWQTTTRGQAQVYEPNQIYRITLMEDVIFDKRRSRLYYDMIAMKFEAYDDNTGTYKPLGWFKYKDLEKLFRNHPKDAIWFNRYNTAENRNYADAFLLRLFRGVIEKVENPDDDTIADTYRNNQRPYKEGVWAMEWEEMRLMEKEHNLWEY
jgi:gliding motility associated protien GldN